MWSSLVTIVNGSVVFFGDYIVSNNGVFVSDPIVSDFLSSVTHYVDTVIGDVDVTTVTNDINGVANVVDVVLSPLLSPLLARLVSLLWQVSSPLSSVSSSSSSSSRCLLLLRRLGRCVCPAAPRRPVMVCEVGRRRLSGRVVVEHRIINIFVIGLCLLRHLERNAPLRRKRNH